MRYLRQNTATRVTVGPFIAVANGTTPLTAITATSEHLNLMVDDAGVPTLVLDAAATASAGNNDLVFVTGSNAGFCDLELTAAQTNYVGRAMLSINFVTDHLPVFHEFMIVPANVYDSLFGTDLLDVSLVQVAGATTDVSALATNVAAILVDTGTTLDGRIPAALVGGRIDATVDATGMESGATGAIRDAIILRTTVRGAAATGTLSTTQCTTSGMSPTMTAADQLKGRILIFDYNTTTAALQGQATDITASSAAAQPLLTFTALTTAPANGDTFTIV